MTESLNTPGLLRAAAQLIERALVNLDVMHDACPGCGSARHRNKLEARIYEHFTNTPTRLRAAADRLDGHPPDGRL